MIQASYTIPSGTWFFSYISYFSVVFTKHLFYVQKYLYIAIKLRETDSQEAW